jgi:26S proteasome regulatory subunit N10
VHVTPRFIIYSKANRRSPSRWEAQADATNLIFSAKTGANPESSVGLMSMGGNTPEILTTLTTDIGKILDGLHRTKIRGTSHFSTGINVAAVFAPVILRQR